MWVVSRISMNVWIHAAIHLNTPDCTSMALKLQSIAVLYQWKVCCKCRKGEGQGHMVMKKGQGHTLLVMCAAAASMGLRIDRTARVSSCHHHHCYHWTCLWVSWGATDHHHHHIIIVIIYSFNNRLSHCNLYIQCSNGILYTQILYKMRVIKISVNQSVTVFVGYCSDINECLDPGSC